MQALVPAAVASSTPVVLLGHGSPDPRSATAVRAVADLLSRRRATPVVAAFLDHDEPRLPDVDLDDGSAVLPLLLSSAYHARIDVPAAVAALATRVELLSPLGHPPGVLDAVVRDAGASAVVVVAAGTSDENEREVFASAVHDAGRRTGISTRWAFATGSGPRLADVAASSATVVPWLLAPGRLLDAVRAQASANGSPVAGVALLGCPSLQSHLAMLLSC